jgi:hypothetical protein
VFENKSAIEMKLNFTPRGALERTSSDARAPRSPNFVIADALIFRPTVGTKGDHDENRKEARWPTLSAVIQDSS